MKRTYKTRVLCERDCREVIYVSSTFNQGNSLMIFREGFKKIFGFVPPWHSKISCDLTVRLIGEPSPWGEWAWEMAVYKPNRFFFEVPSNANHGFVYVGEFTSSANDGGRATLTSPCKTAVDQIFPGLIETVGAGNTCEIEIIARCLTEKEAER